MRQSNRRKKRPATNIPLYRDFYMYVSGAYEKVYIEALHLLLREKCYINLHCSEYGGGGDFHSGIDALKKDLRLKRTKSVTRNLEKSDKILIQGDMDVAYATAHVPDFEQALQHVDERCILIPSIKNFESWLKAHFVDIANQNEIVSKQDVDNYIPQYSDNTSNAKQYFERHLQWKMVQKAMDGQGGNESFRKFMMVFFDDDQ